MKEEARGGSRLPGKGIAAGSLVAQEEDPGFDDPCDYEIPCHTLAPTRQRREGRDVPSSDITIATPSPYSPLIPLNRRPPFP